MTNSYSLNTNSLSGYLAQIRRFPVLDRRIALTPLRKLWIAWRTWIGS